ncbi:MAG: hypothetical protein ACK46J_07650 [Burkholderiales bacterium]
MDLDSRMIVGDAMHPLLTKKLARNALRRVRFNRKPKPGMIHHGDHGNQY